MLLSSTTVPLVWAGVSSDPQMNCQASNVAATTCKA